MKTYQAVLLDTVSIQGYIFQSNELKENIGASYIIKNLVYGDYLKEALKKIFPSVQIDLNKWKIPPFKMQGDDPFEIGYIGGGKALLLFIKDKDAKRFIQIWTKILMVKSPQVNTAVALLDNFDLNNFQDSKKQLFDNLSYNKLTFSPQTVLPTHGITAECTRSGLSQNKWNKIVKSFVSASSHARIESAKEAKDQINQDYEDILKDQFIFTNDLSKLGQIEGEDSHIAIVHVDGNDIGNYFSNPEIKTLSEMRHNSVLIDTITNSAFQALLQHIVDVDIYQKLMDSMGFDNFSKNPAKWYPIDDEDETKRRIIPIRPIILGGDDLTFVCDGKLGIYFAEKYIQFFEQEAKNQKIQLSSCAGVAIIKSKYPFFRGYRLSEELCKNAKIIRKKEGAQQCSYLDFHIASGAIAGSLDDIRNIHFQSPLGRLHCRPYRIDKDRDDEKTFSILVKNSKKLQKDFPKSNIHELREVITMNDTARNRFLAQIKARKKKLPVIPGRQFENTLFEPIMEGGKEIKVTPYLDMIEMIKYYPLSLQEP